MELKMLKLIKGSDPKYIKATEMTINQVAIIRNNKDDDVDQKYVGLIVMRVYGELIVSLTSTHSWGGNCRSLNALTFNLEVIPNGSMFEVVNNE